MAMERLHSTIYGSITLRQKQTMASIASSPLPARGELWRRRRDGLYAVVIGILEDGNLRSISSFGDGGFWGVDQFIGLFTKVGEFDGSTWEDENGQWRGILTVSLTQNNTVKIVSSTGDIIMDSYSVREFLDKVTFQSAGPASAGARSPPTAASVAAAFSLPAPARGQLWRQKHGSLSGTYGVVVEVGDEKLKRWNKFGLSNLQSLGFLTYSEYVGDFDGSRWTYDGETVSVRLNDPPEGPSPQTITVMGAVGPATVVGIQLFLERATFLSSSTPRPVRGQLWRRWDGNYAVVVDTRRPNPSLNVVDVIWHGPLGKGPHESENRFLHESIYIGEFNGSRFTLEGDTVSVRLSGQSDQFVTIGGPDGVERLDFLARFLREARLQAGSSTESAIVLTSDDSDDDAAGVGGSTSAAPRRNRKRKRKTASERKAKAGATGPSVFHETGKQPAGAFEVLLGDEFTRAEFLDLGNFYIERRLVVESFENDSDDCNFAGGNILYPVLVNKSQVYCVEDILGWLKANDMDPITREKVTSIYVMTEAEVKARQDKDCDSYLETLKAMEKSFKETKDELGRKKNAYEREKKKFNSIKVAKAKRRAAEAELFAKRRAAVTAKRKRKPSGAGSSSMRLQDLKL